MLQAPAKRNAVIATGTKQSVKNSRQFRRLTKTAFDYAIIIPALILLAPLMLIIAVAIKLESAGPVFHRRRVIGLGGQEFDMFTFRTIFIDGNERLINNRNQWVALLRHERNAHDPRITRTGLYLRRYGLDVLPKMFNILLRQMSLVGPQPIAHRDIMRIGQLRMQLITSTLPGLTGLWQIQARNTSLKERLYLDLQYIIDWSFRLDLKILAGTFTAVWEE